MQNSAEEIEIIQTVLEYCRSGGTDQEPDQMRIPVTEYTQPERLDREIQTFFRNYPIIVGHSSQLSESGQFITHDTTGVPILVTRNREGEVQAFLNVCRHRGARLEGRACGEARSFSCPYHGWTWGLNGDLRGFRKSESFGAVDRDEYALVQLPAFERFGLIWVRPSAATPMTDADMDAWLAPMAEQLESLNIQGHVIYESWAQQRQMNWHILLEGFQEQYHFCTAHRYTACSSYLDTQGVYVDKYPHVRHAVPLTGIDRLADQPQEQWSYRENFMTQNYLFPCNCIQVMTDHIYIHTITPVSTDSCIYQCIMLIPEPPQSEKAEKYWRANYDVVQKVFEEDFTIGEGIQAGLSSGANQYFTIGRNENAIQLARRAMDDALEGRLTV